MKSIPKEFQKNKFFYLMEVNYTPTTPFKYHIINLNSLMFVPSIHSQKLFQFHHIKRLIHLSIEMYRWSSIHPRQTHHRVFSIRGHAQVDKHALPSGKGCRVTAVDKRPLPVETRCGASVCTRNARPASRTSRPAVAMPAQKKKKISGKVIW